MFGWIRRQRKPKPFPSENGLYDHKIKLPLAGIVDLSQFYADYKYDGIPDDKQPKVYVHLVAIYNVDQLASEIAKHLKSGTNEGSKGNDASK